MKKDLNFSKRNNLEKIMNTMKDHIPKYRYFNIENCKRCGKNHRQLLFFEFIQPVCIGDYRINFWSTCPITTEPILMRIEEENTNE